MSDGEAVKHARCSTFKDAVMDIGEKRSPIMGDGEALKHARSSTFTDAAMGGGERLARGGCRSWAMAKR